MKVSNSTDRTVGDSLWRALASVPSGASISSKQEPWLAMAGNPLPSGRGGCQEISDYISISQAGKLYAQEDTKEYFATTLPFHRKKPTTMTPYPTFREVYNNCLSSGIATSESTSIHIQRSVTTMNRVAAQYRTMNISISVVKKDYSDNVTLLSRKCFPFGFFSHCLFLGFSSEEREDSIPEVVLNVNFARSSGNVAKFVISYLDTPAARGFIAELKLLEFKPPISVTQIKTINAEGRFNKDRLEYNPEDNFEPHVEFYPFIASLYPEAPGELFTIEHIVQDFMESKSNLMLLIGPAGTAKSTLIRSFIRAEHEVLLVTNAQVLESPGLSNTFRHQASSEGKRMVTVYEDADVFVAPRERGNLALSSMLNQLDGVLGSKEKFIISTNLESLSKVDKALIRPGRCHKVIQFRPLEGEEINRARGAVGKPPIDINGPMTLSEALNYTEGYAPLAKPTGFGFSR